MTELVFKSNQGSPITTSLLVAGKFNKRHSDVLKAIEQHIEDLKSTDAKVRWFIESTYCDAKGENRKLYIMNRDGFSLLVMSFNNTKDVLQFKLDFIDAFNRMEEAIKKSTQIDFSNPDTVLQLAQNWKDEQVLRIEAEKKVEKLQPKADFVDKVLAPSNELVDVGQAAKLLKLPYGRNTFFKKLRDSGIFFKNRNEPKQEYVKLEYFKTYIDTVQRNNHPDLVVIKVLITQKGLAWLNKMFGTEEVKVAKTAKIM